MIDSVYISRNSSRSERKYHTTECITLPDNPREIDRERAEEFGFEHCKNCSGEVAYCTDQNHSIYNAAKAYGDSDD